MQNKSTSDNSPPPRSCWVRDNPRGCCAYLTRAGQQQQLLQPPGLSLPGPGDVSPMEAAPSLLVNIDAVSLSDE